MQHLKLDERFVPRPRITMDGKQYWCVYDRERGEFSTYTCHGRYRNRRECEMAIVLWNVQYSDTYFR